MVEITYHAVSDIGCVRANNEDMAYVAGRLLRDAEATGSVTPGDGAVAFAVADGMGGYEGGEVASEIVCRAFAAFVRERAGAITEAELKAWAVTTNALVLDTAALRPTLTEMGTTFVALVLAAGRLWMVNIGDSRCYRLRAGTLEQLSTDHSERERSADPDVPSNIIYNYFGNVPPEFFADVRELDFHEGDVFMLCSDGLSDLVTDYYIRSFLDVPDRLVALAKQGGGYDNISLITLRICQKTK